MNIHGVAGKLVNLLLGKIGCLHRIISFSQPGYPAIFRYCLASQNYLPDIGRTVLNRFLFQPWIL